MGQKKRWMLLQLREDKALVIAGTDDPIISTKDLKDAIEAIGVEKLESRLIEGAHNMPDAASREIVDEICEFWNMERS
jgi:hypothetical protein